MLTWILLEITMLLWIDIKDIEIIEPKTEIVVEIEDVILELEKFVESL